MSEPMPVPSGSALFGAGSVGAGAPSYQTPGNSLHEFVSPPRHRGRRESLGTVGTPLSPPALGSTERPNRRDSLGLSVGGSFPLTPTSPSLRRPELGRLDGFRQQTRANRRLSMPMSNITEDPNVRPLSPPLHHPYAWVKQGPL